MGDPRFHAVLKELGELHDKKQADYGRDDDPFANIRSTEEWGLDAWAGAMMRANDKMKRLQSFARKGVLANESVQDSLLDIAVYAIIASILYTEQSKNERPEDTSTSMTASAKDAGDSHSRGICRACGRPALEHTATEAMGCEVKITGGWGG